MERHPEYKYYIERISENDSWLFIGDRNHSGWGTKVFDAWDEDKDTGPIEYILRIKEQNQWDIEKVKDLQYRFEQDELGTIFQWDDLFGFVAVIKDWDRLNEVLDFLSVYWD